MANSVLEEEREGPVAVAPRGSRTAMRGVSAGILDRV
jgi:hypothetical protein